MAKGQGNPPKHTRMSDAQLRGLHEAGANGTEVLTYALLTRFHNDQAHPSRAFVSAQYASDATGIDQSCVSRALRGLCRKHFTTDPAGRPVSVLSQVSRGHNGRAATYDDNLYRCAVLEQSYPIARQGCNPTDEVAGQFLQATRQAVARQKDTSSKAERHQLQGNAAAPHKDTLLATQPNRHAKGTEGRGCTIHPPVSGVMVRSVTEAPRDSYGYTEEEMEEHYREMAECSRWMSADAMRDAV